MTFQLLLIGWLASKLSWVAQGLVQMSFEYLHGWGFYNLSGHFSDDHPHGKNFLSNVQLEFPMLQFVMAALCLFISGKSIFAISS